MSDKPPSSLDYALLLHELTLKKWLESVLTGDWERAEISARKLSESHEKLWCWLGFVKLAITALCRGRASLAVETLDKAAGAYNEALPLVVTAKNTASHVLVETGHYEKALSKAEQAAALAPEGPSRDEALLCVGLALLRQGKPEAATGVIADLCGSRGHHLKGELALARGDLGSAIPELEQACSSTVSRAAEIVPAQFSLGTAYREATQWENAARELSGIAQSSHARIHWPIFYVRSLYLLGNSFQKLGDSTAARGNYERFSGFWEKGEIDPERLDESRRFLSGET